MITDYDDMKTLFLKYHTAILYGINVLKYFFIKHSNLYLLNVYNIIYKIAIILFKKKYFINVALTQRKRKMG